MHAAITFKSACFQFHTPEYVSKVWMNYSGVVTKEVQLCWHVSLFDHFGCRDAVGGSVMPSYLQLLLCFMIIRDLSIFSIQFLHDSLSGFSQLQLLMPTDITMEYYYQCQESHWPCH